MIKGNRIKAVIAMLIATGLFGFTFMGTKYATSKLSIINMLQMRWTLAFIACCVCVAIGILKLDIRHKPVWKAVLLGLIFPCAYTICDAVGIRGAGASNAALVYAIIPAAITLGEKVVNKKLIGKQTAAGIGIAFAGAVMTVDFAAVLHSGAGILSWFCLFGAIITETIYYLRSEKLSDQFNTMELTFIMCMTGCVFFIVASLIKGGIGKAYATVFADPYLIVVMLVMGVLCTIVAYFALNYAIVRIEAHKVSAVACNGSSVIGVITGVLIMGENFRPLEIVGTGLVVLGIILANRSGRSKELSAGKKDLEKKWK